MSATHRPPPSSPLFTLSAELRNVIYKYVLTTSKPVICIQSDTAGGSVHKYYEKREQVKKNSDPHSNETLIEMNHMQYVSRLLRHETSSLVPTSHIFFQHSNRHASDPASVTCSRWLPTLARTQIDALRTITVHEQMPRAIVHNEAVTWKSIFDLNAVKQLAHCCSSNPHLHVNIKLSRFDKRLNKLCRRSLIGYIVTLAVRKENCCADYGCTAGEARVVEEAVERMGSVWDGFAMDRRPLTGNLRFFPVGRFQGDDWPTGKSRPRLRGRIERWYEEGI